MSSCGFSSLPALMKINYVPLHNTNRTINYLHGGQCTKSAVQYLYKLRIVILPGQNSVHRSKIHSECDNNSSVFVFAKFETMVKIMLSILIYSLPEKPPNEINSLDF